MEYQAHPAVMELAKVFSSVKLLGPPMDDKLARLVAHLFEPEEAELAAHLPIYYPQSLEKIAKKSKRNAEIIRPILKRMGDKRVIMMVDKGYALLPIIPGMFEYMLMDGRDSDWHRRYAELLMDVWTTGYVGKYNLRPNPAVRNIPVQSAVADYKSIVADVDLISELLDRHTQFAVANVCQCRQSMRFLGKDCKRAAPEDGCLLFGSFAPGQEKYKSGRMVSRDEMRAIAAERWEKKLVFMTGNVALDSPNAICTCCDCCCHFMETIHHWNGMALVAPPHFLASVNESLCKHCGKCAKACNTRAHTMTREPDEKKRRHAYNPNVCIGCGLCVAACPEGAIALAVNPAYKPPAKGFLPLLLKMTPGAIATSITVSRERGK